LLAVVGVAAFTIGLRLEPSGRGLGTHQQLGLAPCDILTITGWPCATCGYTTAVTLLAHGRPLAAIVTQPAGALIGVGLFSLPFFSLWVILTRRRLLGPLLDRVGIVWVALILLVGGCSWVYKLLLFH
jgi:hypothetical protein